jgi:hypothetical protein
MSIQYRTLIGFLILALAVPGFSQEANTKKATKTQPLVTNEEPRVDGLKRISGRPAHG